MKNNKPCTCWIKNLLKKLVLSHHGIKPFNIDKSKIVILGTFPGEDSLKVGQYYTNPSNQFWELLGIDKKYDYATKTKILRKHKIGLWDVIQNCEREGSMDKNIKNPVYNNLGKLKDKKIFFNGKKAYNYYLQANKIYNFGLDVSEKENVLPSSSCACAIKNKKQQWKKKISNIKQYKGCQTAPFIYHLVCLVAYRTSAFLCDKNVQNRSYGVRIFCLIYLIWRLVSDLCMKFGF